MEKSCVRILSGHSASNASLCRGSRRGFVTHWGAGFGRVPWPLRAQCPTQRMTVLCPSAGLRREGLGGWAQQRRSPLALSPSPAPSPVPGATRSQRSPRGGGGSGGVKAARTPLRPRGPRHAGSRHSVPFCQVDRISANDDRTPGLWREGSSEKRINNVTWRPLVSIFERERKRKFPTRAGRYLIHLNC